jgi:histidyl-tRNA synthetase
LLGDDERSKGEVAIKNMRTGEQRTYKRGELDTVAIRAV